MIICGLGSDHERRKTIPTWNGSAGSELFRASLCVRYLQLCAQCHDLVTFELREGGLVLVFFKRHNQMGVAYSSLCRTKVLCATSFVGLGSKAKFL